MLIHKLHRSKTLAVLLLTAILGLLPLAGLAADDEEEEDARPKLTLEQAQEALAQNAEAPLTEDGADTCLKCHDEDNEYPIFPIFKTKHAVSADERAPFGRTNQCETCHGNGGEHAKRVRRGHERPPILNFGKDAWTPVPAQNDRCLQCHQNHERIEWKGSIHDFNELACVSCHTIHVAHDSVLDEREQPQVCFGCHLTQRAQFQKAFHHPVREGELACTDCHDVHGDDRGDLMVLSLARDKCTSCHAEKRGPFFWEHAPAAEDCRLCHDPHGSNFAGLLKKRPPQLCQQCHSQFDHPSVRYDGLTVRPLGASRYPNIKGCLNCHSQVHGSNHPSGVTLAR